MDYETNAEVDALLQSLSMNDLEIAHSEEILVTTTTSCTSGVTIDQDNAKIVIEELLKKHYNVSSLDNDNFYDVILQEVKDIFGKFVSSNKAEANFNKFILENNHIVNLMHTKEKLEQSLKKSTDAWFKEFERHALIRLWFITGVKAKSDTSINLEEEIDFQRMVLQQENDKIEYSAGWVFKRIREIVIKSKSLLLKVKPGEPDVIVDKESVLEAIESVITDSHRRSETSYEVIPDSRITDFFVLLHEIVNAKILSNDKTKISPNIDKNIFIEVIKYLATHYVLRQKWHIIFQNTTSLTETYLFKQCITFFMKFKQKLLVNQHDLGPKKHSVALRKSLQSKGNKN